MSTETQSATSSAEHGLNGSSPAATAAGKKPKKHGAASASASTKTKRKAKASASSRKPTKKSAKKAAAGKAKIAKGATYALVARLGKEVYDKAWKKVEKLAKAQKDGEPRISMSSWLVSVITRAAK